MYKLVVFIVILLIIGYYLNSWINGGLYMIPKWIAIGVTVMAIMFPRDYYKIPNIIREKITL